MTNSATSTDLAVPVRSSLDLASLNELAEMMRSNDRVEIVDDPEAIGREIFEQILGSKTDADLNQMGQATGWKNIEGVQVKLKESFRWRPSTYAEGAPVFLVVTADKILADGQLEPVVLTTGSRNVIAQLMNLAGRGTYDGRIVSLERAQKASSKGFFPLWLKIHNPVTEEASAEDNG